MGPISGAGRGPLPPRNVAAVAGLAGAAAVIGVGAVVHSLAPSIPFLPAAVAQTLVRAAPGELATAAIEVLGHWALRLATAGTGALLLAAGAVSGLLIRRADLRPPPHAIAAGILGFVPMWLLSVAMYPAGASVSRWAFALASAPIHLVGGALAGWFYRRLIAGSDTVERRTDLTRRYVVRSLGVGTAGLLLGFADLGRLIYRRPDPGARPLDLAGIRPAPRPPTVPDERAWDSVRGLTAEVTPNDRFYVVDEEIFDPDLDPATWRLDVGGAVRSPFSLTYDELTSFPLVERYQTLECISNEVGGGLISTAKWVGVPLPLILERAGVQPAAVEVVFTASGGYSDSLGVTQAMDEGTLIVVGMNDHVLPRAHGFPARLLSVGTYGMKNPKWLTGIRVTDRPYQGYWEERGWSKEAIVKTGSRIDAPAPGQQVGGPLTIAGVAFAGDRGISRVEVSADGGITWAEAELKPALSDLAWRLWRYRWKPAGTGPASIMVRAHDGDARLQTAVYAAPHPDGASGYHAITVSR